VETRFIYRLFADIPRDAVDASIDSLLDRGWLRKAAGGEGLHLTEEGRAEIRDFIPSPLRPTCEPPEECR
jgi:DNA-binding MarR family transcriptional regulator